MGCKLNSVGQRKDVTQTESHYRADVIASTGVIGCHFCICLDASIVPKQNRRQQQEAVSVSNAIDVEDALILQFCGAYKNVQVKFSMGNMR